MNQRLTQLLLFICFSMLQVRFVDAKNYTIPAEDPLYCVKNQQLPCAISTGERPRIFQWVDSVFELDRNIVLESKQASLWHLYKGMMVIDSRGKQTIHTPFADIKMGQSKVLFHVLDNKVRVMSLSGEGVIVKPKGSMLEHFLVPGFQNWYGGVVDGESETGVVSVIELESYAKRRAKFFMNHQFGFLNELNALARTVKWAAAQASLMHRSLVERKMASLEEIHQQNVLKSNRKVEYNKYLRRLFLQKIRYDY